MTAYRVWGLFRTALAGVVDGDDWVICGFAFEKRERAEADAASKKARTWAKVEVRAEDPNVRSCGVILGDDFEMTSMPPGGWP